MLCNQLNETALTIFHHFLTHISENNAILLAAISNLLSFHFYKNATAYCSVQMLFIDFLSWLVGAFSLSLSLLLLRSKRNKIKIFDRFRRIAIAICTSTYSIFWCLFCILAECGLHLVDLHWQPIDWHKWISWHEINTQRQSLWINWNERSVCARSVHAHGVTGRRKERESNEERPN